MKPSVNSFILILFIAISAGIFTLANRPKTLGLFINEPETQWTLVVTGDVMLGRAVNSQTLKYNDFNWAFKNISSTLSFADIAFINLENPLVENCPRKLDGMIFCGDLRHAKAIADAGIDVASLANNHTMNYGRSGLNQTVSILESNGIVPIGVTNPTYLNVKNMKIAFLGYTDIECKENGSRCVNEDLIKKDIKESKLNSDMVIIMYHWGNEYRDIPSARQIALAHMSIDEGADLILGNHPHWVQTLEEYKGKIILYSHGNTIFDQMWSEKTREGIISKFIISKNKIISTEIIPTYIEDYGQPIILDKNSTRAKNILCRITSC